MALEKVNSKNAFALVELLIATGLLAVISLCGASMINNQHRGIKQNEEISERNDIVANLRRVTVSPIAIFSTYQNLLSSNPGHPLVQCLASTLAIDCDLTNMPPLGWELDYYNQLGQRVSGTSTNPVFYTREGAICNSGQCAFQVETRFIPICPSRGSQCAQASSIKINFVLSPMIGHGVAQSKTFQTEPNEGITDVRDIMPANIVPLGAHFGGIFDTNSNQQCIHPNVITNDCTCQPGFTPKQVSRFDAAGNYGTRDGFLYYCYRL